MKDEKKGAADAVIKQIWNKLNRIKFDKFWNQFEQFLAKRSLKKY